MSARVTCSCGWTASYRSIARAEAMVAKHRCHDPKGRPPSRQRDVRRATRRYRCARCGLEAVYENAGAAEARYWFSRHSCRKREQLMLRAAMAAAKDALIDRTPKPCLHKQANHQHGTNAAYVLDGCRCKPCSKARVEQDRWRARQKAYGRYNKYVPAPPVREHVEALTAAGMGLKQIAKISGVPHGSLWKLMYGKTRPDGTRIPSRRVLRETAEKLYAIDPTWAGRLELAPGAKDPEGTPAARQRLQALVALGWSMSELGRRLGITWESNAITVIRGDRVMQRRTIDAAHSLFDQLCMTLPPETTKVEKQTAARSRRYAREHGWLPPLMLDDLTPVEDLDVTPINFEDLLDHAMVERALNHPDLPRPRRLTRAEAAEVCRRARARGHTTGEIERLYGLKLERYLRIKPIPDTVPGDEQEDQTA